MWYRYCMAMPFRACRRLQFPLLVLCEWKYTGDMIYLVDNVSTMFTRPLSIGLSDDFSTHRAVLPQDLVKFEAARFGFRLFQSLWGLTCTSTEVPRCLSICKEMRSLYHQISRLPDFARFGVMTSYRLVNERHGLFCQGINYTIITKQTTFQLQLEKQICGIDVSKGKTMAFGIVE